MPNNATPQQSQSSGTIPQKQSQERPTAKPSENEGEGSRSAARNYDEATEQYVKSGRVEEAARKAEAALDGPEGDALRKAELATRATLPGDDERPTPMLPGEPKDRREEGFEEPELMKDESEDRE